MSPILLIVEYRGGGFHGWQRQNGVPTVQAVLEKGLAEFLGHPITVVTSSRTDAGVHGAAHPALIKPPRDLPLKAYLRGLAAHLPDDVSIRQVARTVDDFEIRRDSLGKTYVYRIWNERFPRALLADRSWHVPMPLDASRMAEAAGAFLGQHDLTSFRAAHCDSKVPLRHIERVDVTRDGDIVRIRIRANAFLRNMVRIIVGSLVEVGRGTREPGWIRELIDARDRTLAGRTAPGHGLMLHRVHYPLDRFTELLPPAGPLTDSAISQDRDDDFC
ncbi:MAG: tRNA pseudouridine(38-40) synthase TruA [Pseudomonadota bacterium]